MNDHIIQFYLLTNQLKEKIRNGWIEIGISAERLESVAEHIYGCLMLAIAIDSEYQLRLDMYKVLKMLALHELEETLMKDFTIRDAISAEQKMIMGRKCVEKATEGLAKQEEICKLLEEFNAHQTKESLFAYHIDKIECDFQAKLYDLKGSFHLEKALEDLKYFGDRKIEIKNKVKTASDIWIEYDKPRYENDDIFKQLLIDIQSLKDYNKNSNEQVTKE